MTIEHLKLYHFPATRSARVKWMLHEVVGDAFEVVRVALYDGAHRHPDFKRLNPNQAVPVLEIARTDGTVQIMIESGAMVAFLADAYPQMGLAPAPTASTARADYLQMLQFGSSWMDMMLWQVRTHEHVLTPDQQDPRTVERYRAKFVEEVEPQLIERLDRGAFVCGETFTAADCVIGHNVFWARGYGLCQGRQFRRYLSTLSKRAAFAAAFDDTKDFTLDIRPGAAPTK